MMDIEKEYNLLESLFPFGFLIDNLGKIVRICPSAIKFFSHWTIGYSITDEFSDTNHNFLEKIAERKLVILKLKDLNIKLRGEFIPLGQFYFFAGNLQSIEMKDFIRRGLSYKDFSAQDPIFDYLMLINSEKIATMKLKLTLEEVSFKNNLYTNLSKTAAKIGSSEDADVNLRELIEGIFKSVDVEFICAFKKDTSKESLYHLTKHQCCKNKESFKALINKSSTLDLNTDQILSNVHLGESISWNILNVNFSTPGRGFDAFKAGCNSVVLLPVFYANSMLYFIEIYFSKEKKDQVLFAYFELCQKYFESIIERNQLRSIERDKIAKETQNSKLISLGEMSAGIAHEINNPLAIIQGKAQTLLTHLSNLNTLDEKAKVKIDNIIQTCSRISKIINGLKAFSRNASLDKFENYSIHKLMGDVELLCENRIRQFGIKFKLLYPENDLTLCCRPVQITQILINLLNNSIDEISEKSNPWIDLKIEKHGDYIVFTLTDSGNGIPLEVAEKIMNPFFTTKEPGKGTGIGLSISYAIALDHQGTLRYVPDQANTQFELKIPLVRLVK